MIEVMGLSARSITVSTVGMVPGIRRLAEEPWPVSLAVSLHAADDELRSTLVPINRRYPWLSSKRPPGTSRRSVAGSPSSGR